MVMKSRVQGIPEAKPKAPDKLHCSRPAKSRKTRLYRDSAFEYARLPDTHFKFLGSKVFTKLAYTVPCNSLHTSMNLCVHVIVYLL